MTWDLARTGELPTEARAVEEAQAAADRQPDRHTSQADADQRALRSASSKPGDLADTALDLTPEEHRRHGEKPTLFREMVRRVMRQ
jgi:hypothetical protein